MKVLITFLISLSFCLAWAAEEIIPKEEGSFYGTTLREKELEAQLLESDFYKNCKENSKNTDLDSRADEINTCVNDALENTSAEDIKKLAEKANLASINQEQTKTAKGIREYLSERLARAIYGSDYDAKNLLSKRKFVDQTLFFDLYAEQLGKNVLLEVSNYCLENLRHKDNIANATIDDATIKTPDNCLEPFNPDPTMDEQAREQAYNTYLQDCLPKLIEVNYPLQNVPEAQKALATVATLQEASKKEIQTQGASYFEKKSGFCAKVVADMCDRYKCKTSPVSNIQAERDRCTKLGIIPDRPSCAAGDDCDNIYGKASPPLNKPAFGTKACVVISRIREYKKTITQVQEMKEKLNKTGKNGSGFNPNIYYDGAYQGGKGDNEQSLSEIATISSREITENSELEDLYLSEEEANELADKCQNDPNQPDCKKLVDTELKEKNVAMETAFETETKVRLKEIEEKFDEGDREEIKEYLERLGLSNLYSEQLNTNDLKKLIEKHYKKERDALITEMKNKLKDKLKVQKADGSTDQDGIDEILQNTISDLKDQKDRLETILHYNNVVTSFLKTSEQDGSNASLNTVALQREMQDFEKYQDEDDNTDASTYFQQVTDGGQSNNQRSNATGLQYMDYIDSVLGGNKE